MKRHAYAAPAVSLFAFRRRVAPFVSVLTFAAFLFTLVPPQLREARAAAGDPIASSPETSTSQSPAGGPSSPTPSAPSGLGGIGSAVTLPVSPSGSFSYSYPFELPHARGNVQPQLELAYDSNTKWGIGGTGWNLNLLSITRVPLPGLNRKGGLRKQDDPPQDVGGTRVDRYVTSNGDELVPICVVYKGTSANGMTCSGSAPGEVFPKWSGGWRYFRPRVESNFARYFLSLDTNTWRVQFKDPAIDIELGRSLDGLPSTTAPDNTHVDAIEYRWQDSPYRWFITRAYDGTDDARSSEAPHPTNQVLYRYVRGETKSWQTWSVKLQRWGTRLNLGPLYLSDIYSTSPRGDSRSTADYKLFAQHIHLAYEGRDDKGPVSYLGRNIGDYDRRVARVDVTSKPFGSSTAPRELVRRYKFTYLTNAVANRADSGSFLRSIQMEGRCKTPSDSSRETNEVLPDVIACTAKAPATTFGYDGRVTLLDPPSPIADINVIEIARPKIGDKVIHYVDVNHDGLTDILVTSTGLLGKGHGLFLNGMKGVAGQFTQVAVDFNGLAAFKADTADSIAPGQPGVLMGDFDGNGQLDLLVAPIGQTARMYSLQGSATAWSWKGTAFNGPAGLPTDNLDNIRIADVDGDGAADVIVTTKADIETFFSLARLPGGSGRFGSSGANSDGLIVLYADPVRSPLPHTTNNSPILLERSDVRLADMDGDHLPDVVQIAHEGVHVWHGNGEGVFGAIVEGNFGAVNEDGFYALGADFRPDASTVMRLGDVSGDGRDDLVVVRAGSALIWLNNAAGGFGSKPDPLPSVPNAAPASSLFKLASMRGLGGLELVWDIGGKVVTSRAVRGDGLLHRISNGYGGTTDIEYQTMTSLALYARLKGNEFPSPNQTDINFATTITTSDNRDLVGGTKGTYTTHLTYEEPIVDSLDQHFVGFGAVTQSFDGDTSRAGESIRVRYNRGDCVDDPDTTDNECSLDLSIALGNPRAALQMRPKTVEHFDANGQYLEAKHYTYRLRHVMWTPRGWTTYAFVERTDLYRYGPGGGSQPTSGTVSLDDVRIDRLGSGTPTIESSATPTHYSYFAWIAEEQTLDAFGNVTQAKKLGRVNADPEIRRNTTWQIPSDDQTGWTFRPVRNWSESGPALNPTITNDVRTIFDGLGRPVVSTASLSGSTGVDRFREQVAGETASVPPAPPGASSDGSIQLFSISYDELGNPIGTISPNKRCTAATFDSVYGQLPTDTTVFVGTAPVTPNRALSACGSVKLTSFASFDRGMERMTQSYGYHLELAKWEYDEFGRLTALYAPQTSDAAARTSDVSTEPTVKMSYDVTQDVPLSRTLTQTLFEAPDGTHSYRSTWQLNDGLHRPIATFAQADPSTAGGDDGAWIVRNVVDRNVRGDVLRSYLPWFSNVDPASAKLSALVPSTKAISVLYDAFGRVQDAFDIDGTRTMHASYTEPLAVTTYDAEDLNSHSAHANTPIVVTYDGHGRATAREVGGRKTIFTYNHDGKVVSIEQKHSGSQDASVVRTMAYDSLGRMVLNVEPNSATASPTIRAWRYAYNDNGDLVGTSDARGCGKNIHYDAGGRILAEDYWPCLASQGTYSPPNLTTGDGTEVFYVYDTAPTDGAQAVLPSNASLTKGHVAAVYDRGGETVFRYDGRGRTTGVARRIARPDLQPSNLSERYSDHWFVRQTAYREDGTIATSTTGADIPELAGASGVSSVSPVYSKRGVLVGLNSSYGPLLASTKRSAEGLSLKTVYGDLAGTTTTTTYDNRLRVHSSRTERASAAGWSASPAVISPPPTKTTTPLVLDSAEYSYDGVGNPLSIKDTRTASELAEWPVGAKPASRTFAYDDQYRVTNIATSYGGGDDAWRTPYGPETAGTVDDTKLDRAMPMQAMATRSRSQSFAYDWLGNTIASDDDAHAFFDRSLGTITNGQLTDSRVGAPVNTPNQLRHAEAGAGYLNASYDASGNLTAMKVRRPGSCLPAGASCIQRFEYTWDEVGRLSGARRWDIVEGIPAMPPGPKAPPQQSAVPMQGALASTVVVNSIPKPDPTKDTETLKATVSYAYDSSGQRTRKSSTLPSGETRHSLFVFDSLEVRRAQWFHLDNNYDLTASTEVPRLGGIARVVYANAGLPLASGGKRHVFLELPGHLGSTGTVLDKDTGELVEKKTFQPFGSVDSDYRTDRWGNFREEVGFTGKEEDIEVGLVYFGARFLVPALGRWASPDPLAIHAAKADLNVYAYVRGQLSVGTDPTGLDTATSTTCSDGDSCQNGPADRRDVTLYATPVVVRPGMPPEELSDGVVAGRLHESDNAWGQGDNTGGEGAAGDIEAFRWRAHNALREPATRVEWVARKSLPLVVSSVGAYGTYGLITGLVSALEGGALGGALLTTAGVLSSTGVGLVVVVAAVAVTLVVVAAISVADKEALGEGPEVDAMSERSGRGGETEATARGREAHQNWDPGEGFEKEFDLPSGKRADAVNVATREVIELKPNNPEAIRLGEQQVKGYVTELEKMTNEKWTGRVETYEP